MRHLIFILVICCTSICVAVGEDSGGGGRHAKNLFDSMDPKEAWSHQGFKKNIPSIQMPGTKSYFKATSLCILGSKIRTKKVMAEACVKWSYLKDSLEFLTESRTEATRNNANCISYESSILSHPTDYNVERIIKGVKDSDGNLRDLDDLEKELAFNSEIIEEKRVVSQSVSKQINVEFYDQNRKAEKYNSEDYLGVHKYRLDKCKIVKQN